MVITVPRMGNICIAAKALFDELKIPYIMPEKNNKDTLRTGSYVSPEEICLPFKLMMGNYLECIKKGADTILITGSCGPCRFGEYCELQKNILKKLGTDIQMIVIDSPSSIGIEELRRRIKLISSESSINSASKLIAIRKALTVLSLADRITAKAHYIAGYEKNHGETKKLLEYLYTKIFLLPSADKTIRALRYLEKSLDKIDIDNEKRPLKIALIGEIYSMIEPYSNLFIEEKMMDYGISTERLITPSWWMKDLLLKPLKLNSPSVRKYSKKYLPEGVGGHARESIAHAVLSGKEGFDGVIQIYPLGCMPEIITRSILPVIQKENGLPIMSLIMDDITGEAGYVTRIEAFIDMLQVKKRKEVLRA